MKVLAVYGSNYGQAQAVLRRVTDTLEAGGHDVSVFKGTAVPSGISVQDFDAAIVVASIRMGRYQNYMLEFVKRNAAALRCLPSAFISVNGTRPESDPEWRTESQGYVAGFLEQTSWQPRWTGNFAGMLQYRSYGLLTRWIMKRISRERGGPTDTSRDYEFTDWDAVDRFAGNLAAGLGG